jgi:hypothetical protein
MVVTANGQISLHVQQRVAVVQKHEHVHAQIQYQIILVKIVPSLE